MARIDALIMAAGSGERFGGRPKQFLPIAGRPVLVWSVERFSTHLGIDTVTVVVSPGNEESTLRLLEDHHLEKIAGVVARGRTRQDSVRVGLESLNRASTSVLVHDAARPCVSGELVQRVLDTLSSGHDAVVPAMPVVDTLIHERTERLEAILNRTGISGVQTPQGFSTDLLRRAHSNALTKGIVSSDDGSLVFALSEPVATVPGDRSNIKITYEDDIPIAEAILAMQARDATGFEPRSS